jgi:hypothetical protein
VGVRAVRLACSYLFILAATFLHPAVTLHTAKYHHLSEAYRTATLNARIVHVRLAASEEQGSENYSSLATTH